MATSHSPEEGAPEARKAQYARSLMLQIRQQTPVFLALTPPYAITDRHPALLHQLFDMPVTQGIGDIPAHAHEHDIWWKMGSLEADRHRRSSSLCLRSSQPESIPQMYPKRKLATESVR